MMQRRGFLFGAGATLAVIAAPALMKVSSKLLLPEYKWLYGLDIAANGHGVTAMSQEIYGHVNCRCVLKPMWGDGRAYDITVLGG